MPTMAIPSGAMESQAATQSACDSLHPLGMAMVGSGDSDPSLAGSIPVISSIFFCRKDVFFTPPGGLLDFSVGAPRCLLV